MCGIAGSLNWVSPDQDVNVKKMTDALIHRGPDAGGTKKLGPVILGHRRLSIIDTGAHANQPMQDITGNYWIVFNGEIYNFQEIKKELVSYGARFATHSDTEVILEAWKQWGVDCLQHFVGMFAFALWDNVKQELILARDRMGEKPLYYMPFKTNSLQEGVIFASELNALAVHPEFVRDVNFDAVNQFLTFNYILTDSCIVESCYKLPPAHYLLFRKNHSPSLVKYWDLAQSFHHKKTMNEKEAIEEFHALLDKSLRQQSISDVPLGAFLSGGVDSSTIVATLVHNQIVKDLQTYSIGFEEKSYSELDASSSVACFLNLNHHIKTVNVDMAKELPMLIAAAGEPFADSSLIPTYHLAQFAREKLTVCLSGDGGDELFLGYDTYIADMMMQYIKRIPPKMRRAMFSFVSKLFSVKFDKVSLDTKIRRFAYGCMHDTQKAHYLWKVIYSEEDKKKLVHTDYHAALDKKNPYASYESFYNDVQGCHFLDQASYVDMKTWLVDDILVKVDRMAMKNSLEVRAPFLDHRIVEFAASLPVNLKLKRMQKKYVLKKSQEGRLPKDIIYRPKRGFNSPISIWLKDQLRDLAMEVTLDQSVMPWFSKTYIEQMWREHNSMQADHGLKLFGLLSLGLWMKNR